MLPTYPSTWFGGSASTLLDFPSYLKQSLDSFYITDSPLGVTNIAEMAMFYVKLTSLNDFPIEEVPVSLTGQFK